MDELSQDLYLFTDNEADMDEETEGTETELPDLEGDEDEEIYEELEEE